MMQYQPERHAPATADGMIEGTFAYNATLGQIRYRKLDPSNYWAVRLETDGSLVLREFLAGVATARGTVAAVFTSGQNYRVIVVVVANVHKVLHAVDRRSASVTDHLYRPEQPVYDEHRGRSRHPQQWTHQPGNVSPDHHARRENLMKRYLLAPITTNADSVRVPTLPPTATGYVCVAEMPNRNQMLIEATLPDGTARTASTIADVILDTDGHAVDIETTTLTTTQRDSIKTFLTAQGIDVTQFDADNISDRWQLLRFILRRAARYQDMSPAEIVAKWGIA
jgi:hypothetical protein